MQFFTCKSCIRFTLQVVQNTINWLFYNSIFTPDKVCCLSFLVSLLFSNSLFKASTKAVWVCLYFVVLLQISTLCFSSNFLTSLLNSDQYIYIERFGPFKSELVNFTKKILYTSKKFYTHQKNFLHIKKCLYK